MRRFCKLLVLVVCIVIGSAFRTAAQQQSTDSVQYSTMDTAQTSAGTEDASESATYEDSEPESPPRKIIYNASQPGEKQWEQSTSNDVYGYRDVREFVVVKEEKPKGQPMWLRVLIKVFNFLASKPGQVILWVCFGLIVGFVAYRIFVGQGGSIFARRDRKRATDDAGMEVSEEGLLSSDWEEKLRKAIAAGDKRLAIRFSYMHLLQVLQERGLIAYRNDKTNSAYYYELTESLRPSFRTVSRQYEYAWYGRFLPDSPAMDAYMRTYEALRKSISYT